MNAWMQPRFQIIALKVINLWHKSALHVAAMRLHVAKSVSHCTFHSQKKKVQHERGKKTWWENVWKKIEYFWLINLQDDVKKSIGNHYNGSQYVSLSTKTHIKELQETIDFYTLAFHQDLFFQQLPLAHMSNRLTFSLEAIKPVLNVATISINPYKWNKCSSEEFSLWFKQREDAIDFDEPIRWRQYNDVTKRWQQGCRVSDWKSMQNYAVKHEEMCALSKSQMKTSINATSARSHQQQ